MSNKNIIIIVIVVVLIGGFIVFKNRESEKESKKSEEEKAEKIGGDCGVSDIYLSDFGTFDELDFENDKAMVCMGKSITKNCTNAETLVKADDFDLTYKVLGTNMSNCKVRFEYDSPDDEEFFNVECPISGLVSSPYFQFKENIYTYPGTYANEFLVTVMDILDIYDDPQAAEDIGCTLEGGD